jgi:hypothetical protein
VQPALQPEAAKHDRLCIYSEQPSGKLGMKLLLSTPRTSMHVTRALRPPVCVHAPHITSAVVSSTLLCQLFTKSAVAALPQVVEVEQLQRERFKLQAQEYKYFVGTLHRPLTLTACACAKQAVEQCSGG